MKNKPEENTQSQLPLQFHVNFEQVVDFYSKYAEDESHPYSKSSKEVITYLSDYPELLEGFSNTDLLVKYKDQIDLILEAIFPEILTNNEIKAATIPFSFNSFKFSNRFKTILENAGSEYTLSIRNADEDEKYLQACTMILGLCYGYAVDLKRPYYFDIPDKNLGITKHYRVAFNGDFSKITPTEKAPKITEEDVKILLDNYDDIDIWKQKFPIDSYIFKGFGIMTLFDVTADETLLSLRTNLLRSGDNLLENIRQNLSEFFSIKDLQLGYSIYDISNTNDDITRVRRSESLILNNKKEIKCNDFFCDGIVHKIFKVHQALAISNVTRYGQQSGENEFYKRLKNKDIESIILIPIKTKKGGDLAVLEIASPRAYELNSVNQQKLKDIIPVFEAAISRRAEEYHNTLEATIQEHYTSIHPSVKWRFYEASENYQNALQDNQSKPLVEEIVFDEVYPLFGQSDIKGSSVARNQAIEDDLTTQLSLAVNVLKSARKNVSLPIYEELIFRITAFLNHIKEGLNAGDEVNILEFLKKDIYPVFSHLKKSDTSIAVLVDAYMERLDTNLKVVYERRKAYEDSVMLLNNRLANHLDKKQEEAQAMFPHYFERYKTDGVEYNMYIGQSLVKDASYNNLYLYNLRLWQLQTMYEMEQIAYTARKEMNHDLQVASLILVHSNPLAIKFRMDEKQFDVDGAYNIRYEIIKKRIDKAHIKDTDKRLTVPGKIAIVYSQDKDASEYVKYIKYLQAKKQFGKLETLELEDLQGVSGLKALRVEVLYQDDF
jgi:hypothetical protein